MEKAVEAYNAANVRLDQIKHDLEVNQARLETAKKNLVKARAAGLGASRSALHVQRAGHPVDHLRRLEPRRPDRADRLGQPDCRPGRADRGRGEAVPKRSADAAAGPRQGAGRPGEGRRRARGPARLRPEPARRAPGSLFLDQRPDRAARGRRAGAPGPARRPGESRREETTVGAGTGARTGPVELSGGSSSSAPPPATHSSVVSIALQYLGVPYVWGGASPSGFDCSGLTMYAYAKVGVYLPHNAAMQYGMGTPVVPEPAGARRPRLLQRALARRHVHRRRAVRTRPAHRRRREDLEPVGVLVRGDVRRRTALLTKISLQVFRRSGISLGAEKFAHGNGQVSFLAVSLWVPSRYPHLGKR